MKTKLLFSLMIILIGTISLAGCSDDDVVTVIDQPPQPPQSVYTITGDDTVFIYWTAPYEGDIAYYGIYRSSQELTGYDLIAEVEADPNPNLDLVYYDPGYVDADVSNGLTYYYAVTSVDEAGQESDLSAETVFDTPRPEGEMTLYDDAVDPNRSGFNFLTGTVMESGNPGADVYLDRDIKTGVFYINATNIDVLLQAAGYHESFDGIGWAPQNGWSYTGWAEIIPGHIYVVAIKDNHGDWNYAKLRVLAENDNAGTVTFQWAYQLDDNNPELVPPTEENTDLTARAGIGSML